MKIKSDRNKTIDFGLEEGKKYLQNAIRFNQNLKFDEIINKNIIGDTFEALDLIEDNSIDLIIVDPPYNLRKNYHGNVFTEKNAKTYEAYTIKWVEKVKDKLRTNGSIYVCCDWKSSLMIGPILAKYFNIKNRITWEREKGRGAKTNWKNALEDIWFATASDEYTFNVEDVKKRKRVIAPYKEDGMAKDWKESDKVKYRDTYPSNFWDDITIPFWSMPENTAHPTQKPEKLIAKLILASSNENDLILDPFMGSGTTSVVAKKLNRRFIGIEQNEIYVAWAEKRLIDAEKNKEIQGIKNGVFYERNFNV
ncbi:DNA-methyltransferase [Helcococcus kunzii]|uniref:DNA-methyltransferase n=1 Tax=Helcococcus kunzii TaxID=40091 RepID=UPI001BAF4511|nr:DNA methyltransferase [Helcococcus kunzii]MCT1796633.1 site-specific DNA-methyltransferase [Helcococcus kunzii]MCT1988723.1 site-specific DNA-methyltransferase [Helcococcus kunzii]QUY64093.1 site-specific DNA-methyltransferase [Helcococcus kunzii]